MDDKPVALWMLVKEWAALRNSTTVKKEFIVTGSEDDWRMGTLHSLWFKDLFFGFVDERGIWLRSGQLLIEPSDPAFFERLEAELKSFDTELSRTRHISMGPY